jgi:hypothetical protein
MRAILAAVVLAPVLAAQESRPESRAESRPAADSRKTSLKDLGEVGGDIVAALQGRTRQRAASKLLREAFDHMNAERLDEALESFDRLRTDFAETHRTAAWTMMVMIHERRGDVDSAIDLVEHEMGRTDGESASPEFFHSSLARLFELKKDWVRALEAWKQAPPLEGAERLSLQFSQEEGIARCEFNLGRVESSLKRLETCLSKIVEAEEWTQENESWWRRMQAWRIAFTYAEFSGRSGRIATARSFAKTLPAALQADLVQIIGIVDRWLAKDAAGILKMVADLKFVEFQIGGPGRLVGELGEPGVTVLRRGIEAGDPFAIRLAAWAARTELLPSLRGLGPDHEGAKQAIAEIEYLTTRPASRPASRRAK